MAYLEELPEPERSHIADLPCPAFDATPFVSGPPLDQRRVAIISTAGLHCREDPPFQGFSNEYRVISSEVGPGDVIMSHISANFDRSGFQRDWNLVFPLDRLRELAGEGIIASVADYHYSFMGATDPLLMEGSARRVAGLLKNDSVNGVLLVPV